jgi:hypothetical protein
MMSSVNVCFSTSNGLVSRVIRWFSRAEVSHALITFYDETLDKVFVMEAGGRGFLLTPWAKWRQNHTLTCRYSLCISTRHQEESIRKLAEFLGSQYDYISLLGFVFRRWVRRMRNPLDSPKRLVCSEAVAMFLRDAGLEPFNEPATWTPGDLLAHARRDPLFELEEGHTETE